MEIERKYLIDEKNLPADLESCRSVLIEQGSASAVRTTTISSPTNPAA